MSFDCGSPASNSRMAQSSAAALESAVTSGAAQVVVSAPRTKTKSKSCGNSPKCGSREHSRPHSPAMTWKKQSKGGSPVAEMEREGGEEAPFGRESGAGSAYSSPYSERATPPYLRWAKSLEDVLDDYEGMELFKQFLAEQKEEHFVDFWYACKGFKILLDAKEHDKIRKVAERLYVDYVATRGVHYLPCLTFTTRTTIHSRLLASNNAIDQTIYDDAHKQVQTYLRERHAQFVGSEAYILYLQDIQVGGWDSPKCYSHEVHSNNSSSSGDARRLPSTLLPTVHEDTEFESESERLAVASSLNSAATATVPKIFTSTEADNAFGGSWLNQVSDSMKPFGPQPGMLRSAMPATSGVGAGSCADEPSHASSASGGFKRRAASTFSSGSGQQMRHGGSLLTRDILLSTCEQRMKAKKQLSKFGGPPHPYHTNTYVPYLTNSTQDSELQSMSSDATTESGFSGANYQRKEYRVMQHHVEHNRDPAVNHMCIPRTERPRASSQAQDMTNEEFNRTVKEKLEAIRREREREEKLQESLQRLSEPENGYNDHRAAVNKFYNDEKNRSCQNEDSEAILSDHCSKVPYFKDTPKQSPLRSPGLAGVGRRRSPIAKSPIRAMTTSYPSAGQPQVAAFSYPNARPTVDVPAAMSQSVLQPSRSKSGHHSAGNTMHRVPKHEPFVPAQMVATPGMDKRSGAIPKKPVPRYAVAASDTSGVYSGTSTEPSLVSARFTPNSMQRGNDREQHWNVDRHQFENSENDGSRHKVRSGSSNTAAFMPNASSEKCHRASGHRSGDKSTTEKSRNQKGISDGSSSQMHRNMSNYPRRSEPVGLPAQSFYTGGTSGPVPDISVGIFLPNEQTPYLLRVPGHQITLKQFKPLIPRKGNFRYFFQCFSDELGTGTVQREVVEDHEILPFCDNNKIVAKIVISE